MQIKKISEDKLKIILNSNDLYKKNVDVDSFLANPIGSQSFFFEILDLAKEKFDFYIENNKAVIETISLDNNVFILTITKISNDFCTYNNNSKVYCFEDINNLLNFYSFIKKINMPSPELNIYKLFNRYYIVVREENIVFENFLLEFSDKKDNFVYMPDILLEYGNRI